MKVIINNKEINLIEAKTFYTRLKGLMFKKNIQEGIFFPKCNSIHTFFMKEPIDLIMVDKAFNVVLIKKNLKKNKIIYKKEAYHTIELPFNSMKDLSLQTLNIID